ncbi:MAG: DUF1893 domain-containing protein [Deltaproteobacteria bacterium]|nr:DUF1893 domain-containing protein [Deltaproteobacteria bacterium]
MIFQSQKKGIAPLLEYLSLSRTSEREEIIALDRIVGNAAALLMKVAGCCEVHAVVASKYAVRTLEALGIPGSFQKVVPKIINRLGTGMCPFELLSLGKSPQDFYILAQSKQKSLNERNNITEIE